jgi:hypothetical protein
MMIRKRNRPLNRQLAIGGSAALVSLAAPLAFAAAPASAASSDHFTCRASALRVRAPPALSLLNAESVVANRQSDPCASDRGAIANAPAALSGLLSTGVATATTTSESASGSATAELTNLTTLGLSLDHATASVRYGCSGATATPVATSNVVDLRDADGMPITTSGPVSLPGGGIADVELNRTMTTATSVSRQAVQITVLTRAGAGTQIVIGQASAGISGNPCATGGGSDGGTGMGGSPGPGGSGGRSAPVNTRRPAISGTPKAGKAVTCSTGRWTNRLTHFAYRWSRNGTPIAGALRRVEKVQTGDEGLSLTCAVTATNALGFGHRATSPKLAVKVPFVRGCPRATDPPRGQKLGLVRLGSTRTQTRRAFTHSSDRGKRFEDFFCLTPIGVRVGYASNTLLKTLPSRTRRTVAGRVVLALTANAFYALHGVRPGATVSSPTRRWARVPRSMSA